MKKVIGFDSWTGGASHFARLVPTFKARGFDLQLVHLGSWGNEPECPGECRMGELLVRDIAFYDDNSLEKILDVEQPVAVILLSTDTFAHRAVIRYCDQRHIPTLNLFHGLVGLTDRISESGAYVVSYRAHARYVLSRLGKLLKHTFPCYIKALLLTKAKAEEWVRFFLDVFHMAKGDHLFRLPAADAKTTKCAVYTQADFEYAIRSYNYGQEDVSVVGNPDFIQFGFNETHYGCWEKQAIGDNTIMYIETGFSSVGLYYPSEQEFVNHLINTSRLLADNGFRMLLKLKPSASNVELIKQKLMNSKIELVDNKNFLTELMSCSACIVESTTLAIIPAIMGMPLLLTQYGYLKSLSFGPVLTSYPRGYSLTNVSDLPAILEKNAQMTDTGKLTQWIDQNAGPLPAEKIPERVAAIVEEMTSDLR